MANGKSILICADNLTALDDLVKRGIRADLIHLDPPFKGGQNHNILFKERNGSRAASSYG
jgi:16S rRNA G966 N2-methylase RsmD